MAILALDVPLQGMVKDSPGKRLGPGRATDLMNAWINENELQVRPGFSAFRNTPQTSPVQQIINAEYANGTNKVVRIDNTKTYFDNGSVWTEITGTRDFTGGGLVPFGWTVSLNRLVFSNGISADGVWEWDGAAASRSEITGGVLDLGSPAHKAFRYCATFSNRVIGAYTNDNNGAITVIGSAPGSTTDWTLANGAFAAVRNEHPSKITNLTSDDNTLIVWKEQAIVTGTETGDDTNPIFWQLLRTEGIGNIAPFAVASHAGFNFGLSYEGFFILSGGVPQFIDRDIRRDFFKRFNYDAVRQIRSVVLPEFAKVAWIVPQVGETYSSAAWIYDIVNQSWDRIEFATQPISAVERVFIAEPANVVDSFSTNPDDLVDGGLLSGTIVDTLGGGQAVPFYIFGSSDGKTYLFDSGVSNDDGSQFAFSWETPDITWQGLEDRQTGRIVGPLDIVTFDRAELEYRHSGSDCPVTMAISTDGGETYTTLESKTIRDTGSRYSRMAFHGRVSGRQVRLKLSIGAVIGFPKFRNLIAFGSPTGEVRTDDGA